MDAKTFEWIFKGCMLSAVLIGIVTLYLSWRWSLKTLLLSMSGWKRKNWLKQAKQPQASMQWKLYEQQTNKKKQVDHQEQRQSDKPKAQVPPTQVLDIQQEVD